MTPTPLSILRTVVVALLCIALIVISSINLGKLIQLNDMRAVYTVCHTAGKQCQDAQERTSTEYLCNTNGKCWVEVK